MTHVYLAYAGPVQPAFKNHDWVTTPVNFLCAYPYIKQYDEDSAALGYQPRRTMLDSGAFSVWRSGKTIDIDALIAECKTGRWTEQVGLDVIGSAEGTRENMDYMLAQGSTAMPVFHIGDPWELLEYYCSKWDKVGLSCRFGEPLKESYRFYEQCFARTWPHKFHSFGWTGTDMLLKFPFHSADSSTWEQDPLAWRNVRLDGGARLHARQTSTATVQNTLQYSIRFYADLQRRLESRWGNELSKL